MKFRLALLAAAAVAIAAPATSRAAEGLACGDVVTTDVTLSESLRNCPTGLVAGADDITIDLNGHAITGLGTDAGAGIEAVGRSGVTVRNGAIRDFAVGVRFQLTASSTVAGLNIRRTQTGVLVLGSEAESHSNQILDNRMTESETGISIFSAGATRVIGNKLVDLTGSGISCRNTFSDDVHIERNRSVGNEYGIVVLFCGAALVDNVASHNRSDGILRDRANGRAERNVANENGGIGINSFDSHGEFVENVTNRNGAHGLAIGDSIGDHGPLHKVTRHTAMRNGGLGIATGLGGVLDGGRNQARHNGDPLECTGVVCN
jgi:nitrous oxidase accessory protein NosD